MELRRNALQGLQEFLALLAFDLGNEPLDFLFLPLQGSHPILELLNLREGHLVLLDCPEVHCSKGGKFPFDLAEAGLEDFGRALDGFRGR
jgi:hypothetical protein